MNVGNIVQGVILVIIGVVIVTTILGQTVDDVQTAGNTVNATNAPLATLYQSTGVLPLVLLGLAFIGLLGLMIKGLVRM